MSIWSEVTDGWRPATAPLDSTHISGLIRGGTAVRGWSLPSGHILVQITAPRLGRSERVPITTSSDRTSDQNKVSPETQTATGDCKYLWERRGATAVKGKSRIWRYPSGSGCEKFGSIH